MIEYTKGLYGLNLLLRVHGSAVFKASIPGIISALLYLLIHFRWNPSFDTDQSAFEHPAAVGVFVTSVTFLIVFRANNGYQRYWEACGAVHHLMSKWLDAVTHSASYHMQCSHYNSIKPPTYFDYHELNRYDLKRERECPNEMEAESSDEARSLRRRRRVEKSIDYVRSEAKRTKAILTRQESVKFTKSIKAKDPYSLMGPPRLDGNWGALFPDDPYGPRATYFDPNASDNHELVKLLDNGIVEGFSSTKGGRTHSLFLQELTHLASLLVAVAFCTLRNDLEGIENPLCVYKPGEPWPCADPDKLPEEVIDWMGNKSMMLRTMKFWCGYTRTPTARARHYASRPMPVIGGVSDAEIAFLQKARGPSAKVNLCWHWLSEFIIREHIAGTLGAVGPPIVSRIFQFLSDGMIHYNHARKIMFIPFPFPHAQLSAFFVLLMMPIIPLLMGQYINFPSLGACLTFLTVTCLVGLHEVARELENPFRNVPNDVPLVTLLAMFNESLITLYSGYHPDQFWDGPAFLRRGRMEWEQVKAANGKFSSDPVRVSAASKESPTQSVEQAMGKKDVPQSTEVDKAQGDNAIAELRELVKNQSKEIDKLRQLVDLYKEVSA